MVPAERLPELREVRDIMFSWMQPVAVLTSQFDGLVIATVYQT